MISEKKKGKIEDDEAPVLQFVFRTESGEKVVKDVTYKDIKRVAEEIEKEKGV